MQIDLGTCYQGMSTCVTIYYILSHDKKCPKELQLLQPWIHAFVLKYFVQYYIIDPFVR